MARPQLCDSPLPSQGFRWLLLLVLGLLPSLSSASCGAPPWYSNMELISTTKATYDIGDRVEYRCRPGYQRRPSEAMFTVCGADGNWLPLSNDACRKKFCPTPADPLNGQINFLNGSYEFGTQIQFVCNSGYYLIGNEILYCELSGSGVQWSSQAPQCEKILCQPPPEIPNGSYGNNKHVFEYLEVVTYTCNHNPGGDPFSMIGEATVHCADRNLWSHNPPECRVVRCPHPAVPNGRQTSGFRAKHFYKARVTFECLEGFFLHGDSTAVCEADGTWQPPLPRCTYQDVQEPPLLNTNVPVTRAAETTESSPSTANSLQHTGSKSHAGRPHGQRSRGWLLVPIVTLLVQKS